MSTVSTARMIAPAWLLLLLSGCHLVYPYGVVAPDAADSGPTGEARVREGGGDAVRPGDAGADGDACAEKQALPTTIAKCPGACSGAGDDCDGLPTYRDPYPTDCNELLYEATFGADPTTGWKTAPAGAWSWTCGKLRQQTTSFGEGRAISTMTLPTAAYLVEARVTLGAIGATASAKQRWSVGIFGRHVDSAAPDYLLCDLWVNISAPYFPVPTPDLHIASKAPGKSVVDAYPPVTKSYDGSAGKTYYLQLWFTKDISLLEKPLQLVFQTPCATKPDCPAVMCRLCDETTCLRTGFYGVYQSSTYINWVPQKPGSVGLMTYGRAATFDYVRAFRLVAPY